MTMERYRLGFDIGGTFTDFVLVDTAESRLHLHKCLTTPADPSVGALQGMETLLAGLAIPLSDVGHIVHGTTLVTNAIIERRGCRIGFLTTKGFRDSLEMGTEQRYDIHDLFLQFPEPLVARRHIREIEERIAFDGTIQSPLDEDGVRDAAAGLIAGGAEAIAVSFLHAYRNPEHERRAQEIIQETHPDIPVSLSSDVDPALKEYERGSTTTANAYVQPLMSRYVETLDSALRENGFTGRFHLMQSSGGLTAPETATAFPVRFLESGPAGGAQATAYVGGMIGHEDILSFDMGGTTAKACLIQDGRPDIAAMLEAGRVHRFKRGSGLPVRAPVIDMIEIGAGGGSIARADSLGLLKIGPDSAGADPGPACYGRGGILATVTDASVALGYLDPDNFVGGEAKLDKAAALQSLESTAQSLGLDVVRAAEGIHRVVNTHMAEGMRLATVRRGVDPRQFALLGFGGAAGLHVTELARLLSLSRVIVPHMASVLSAWGMLSTELRFQTIRSHVGGTDALDVAEIRDVYGAMAQSGETRMRQWFDGEVRTYRSADMRYGEQIFEIEVPLDGVDLGGPDALQALKAAFEEKHEALYTYSLKEQFPVLINARVATTGVLPLPPEEKRAVATAPAAPAGERDVYLGRWMPAPLYHFAALVPGQVIAGPAIVESETTTVLLRPEDEATVSDQGWLDIRAPRKSDV